MKHTPGPWYREPAKSFYVSADNGTQIIASCDRMANAQLIAAAPDLLAALQEMVICFDPYSQPGNDGHNALANALAAIQKATGDSQ
jgi:hypothetical protein